MAVDTKIPIGRLLLAGLAWAAFGAVPAAAQTAERLISNPRVLGEGIAPQSLTPTVRALPHEKVLNLNIVYTPGQLYNPATGLEDQVYLRSYNGTDVDPDTPYVSPTIDAVPGDTIRVNLDNQLPADPTCAGGDGHNGPHCLNGTNLHTHGLWVNPSGNGDNVLLSINPGVKFQYEYNIPSDHPAGTFWYHTHRHGSTALQVSSGMAGALIIRGDREPTQTTQGDLDTLLDGLPDRVLVFQQIQYACRNPDGSIKRTNPPDDKTYRCDPGDIGTIENYDVFSPGQWPESGRYTSINGLVLPTFEARQGQLERWRMIHGGVRDTITLRIVKMKPTAQLAATFSQAQAQAFIQDSCSDSGITRYRVAADGLTMAQAQGSNVTVFQPGYRWDEVVVFPEAGRYCLIDSSSPSAGSVNGDNPNPSLLGFVDVAPGTPVGNLNSYVMNALVTQAEAKMPADIAPVVVADLKAGLKLSKFVPHPDIADSEVTGQQELTFFIRVPPNPNPEQKPTLFEVSNTLNEDDAEPYDPTRLDRPLKLGGVDEWTLQSHFVSHPFHIHVNPFQVVSILDPKGRDVSVLGALDDDGGQPGVADPQYPGLKGVWKDTLWIKGLRPPADGGLYTIKIRTRYQRYIGEFVLHCHILDHEDNGMMQNVAIVLPDGNIAEAAAGASPLQLQSHEMHPKP
ncbi:multicopper oxidase family protein [Mycobacterium sp. KBS0706]|uniref:multicopper oxidase family protein n=1 Tax=Mycobacterium sp. KBS0706 TaxID=2578109 RepID=UPI00110FBBAF|nr:multicopper oxidase family protein [Mycobacterium sp. KBS0706]TSD88625.1 multicopper oxidase family protein [Mycobacterium sp. KBS0706]